MKDEMWLGWFPQFRSGWDNTCDHISSHILWHFFLKQGGERQFSSQCQHQEQSMAELCPSAHHAYALGTLALFGFSLLALPSLPIDSWVTDDFWVANAAWDFPPTRYSQVWVWVLWLPYLYCRSDVASWLHGLGSMAFSDPSWSRNQPNRIQVVGVHCVHWFTVYIIYTLFVYQLWYRYHTFWLTCFIQQVVVESNFQIQLDINRQLSSAQWVETQIFPELDAKLCEMNGTWMEHECNTNGSCISCISCTSCTSCAAGSNSSLNIDIWMLETSNEILISSHWALVAEILGDAVSRRPIFFLTSTARETLDFWDFMWLNQRINPRINHPLDHNHPQVTMF